MDGTLPLWTTAIDMRVTLCYQFQIMPATENKPSIIGKNIKRLRAKKKLSQQALADLSGVTRPVITQLESGRTQQGRSETIEAIANALGVKVPKLFEKTAV